MTLHEEVVCRCKACQSRGEAGGCGCNKVRHCPACERCSRHCKCGLRIGGVPGAEASREELRRYRDRVYARERRERRAAEGIHPNLV